MVKNTTFKKWLMMQEDRHDPVGDLARDSSDDMFRSRLTLLKIMDRYSACEDAYKALEEAYKEYRIYCGNPIKNK